MRVTLYRKEDCSLCDEARVMLSNLNGAFEFQVAEVDIESEPSLMKKYGTQIPVVEVGPYTLRAPFTELDLRVAFQATIRGSEDRPAPSQTMDRGLAIGLNRGLLFFARHWVAVFSLLVLTYVALPFMAPTLMEAGQPGIAKVIYTIYSPLCHQLAFRSWFLFGPQPAYPRQLAGTSLESFGAATGIAEDDYLAARAFLGNPQVGYKVAICERDIAIYGAIFLAGVVFGVFRRWIKPLPLWAWFLFGIVPIALDGGTQLVFGLPIFPFSLFAVRESTPFLRTLTGGLFGVMNVWMAYPYVEETMAETRALVAAKLSAAGVLEG